MKWVSAILLAVSCTFAVAACGGDDDDSSTSTCHDGCVATLAAKCSNGPTDQQSCESQCNALETGACGTQFKAAQACAKGKTITCDPDGNVVISGCDAQEAAFVACLSK